VPANYRFGGNQDEAILPLGPHPLHADPEELIEPDQRRALLTLLENGKLLAES